ncbi:2-amino-4-hydroxy-6-hydroxymethyldihydropteridine diphosphokinase [Anaerobacillus sp. MEB173]|uniref:2-amino-4-hydroxy-6- hydroxymethyldihydropteridine diphosphokinase n=1 Tax=Anaerobacillus sp. MEB173 TaxID=3383345 RepID=UPI003F8F05E4
MMNTAYLGLGSNLGDRCQLLYQALEKLDADVNVTIVKVSSIYETDPVGFEDQDQFLNMAVEIQTNYSPRELLQKTQKIENELGRIRHIHWGPRTLDLDILVYNQENIVMDDLIIPHPRIIERAFVVIPLMELNPNLYLPKFNKTIDVIYEQLLNKEGVHVWKKRSGEGEFGLFES